MDSRSFKIKIKTLDNTLHEFSINQDMNVADLKTIIFEVKFVSISISKQKKIPVNRQRLIFQGKMLRNNDLLSNYKVEEGHVLHLVANLNSNENSFNSGNPNHESENNRSDGNQNENMSEFDHLSNLLRSINDTALNRRNLRRRILQQRTGGFNIDALQSLEVAKQNFNTIDCLIQSCTKLSELAGQETSILQYCLSQLSGVSTPFDFNTRVFSLGQWIDAKDTMDQWVEAKVLNIKDRHALIHFNGWANTWDEWIEMNSPRLDLFRKHTVQGINSRYMSPFPNNNIETEQPNSVNSPVDFIDLLDETSKIMSEVSDMTQNMLNKFNPAHSVAKSEKSEKHITTKQDMELQHVLSGMIEEHKHQNLPEKETKSEKNVYFEDTQSVKSHKSMEKNIPFEDAQSIKSLKSMEYDTISMKSFKSFISASDMKNLNPQLNFPDYISEEDSEERSEISSNVHIPTQSNIRDLQASLIAAQLAPIFDRLGRLMTDLAPHLAILGTIPQTLYQNSQNPGSNMHINPNLTVASIITNESGQMNSYLNSNFPNLNFQMPVMLTPGEVFQSNNNTGNMNRIFGEINNTEIHIQTILGKNIRTSISNTNFANVNVVGNTTNANSPSIKYSNELRSRQDETKEIIKLNQNHNFKESEIRIDPDSSSKIKINEEDIIQIKPKTVTFELSKDQNQKYNQKLSEIDLLSEQPKDSELSKKLDDKEGYNSFGQEKDKI